MPYKYPQDKRTEIIQYARRTTVQDAAKKYGVAAQSIENWNKADGKLPLKIRRFSDAQKREILEYARDFGAVAAADKFDVRVDSLTRWNKDFKIYNEQKKFSNNEILQILDYARDFGVINAANNFNVSKATISRWNDEFKVYDRRPTPNVRQYSDAEKIQFLKMAKQIQDQTSGVPVPASVVFRQVAEMADVTFDQLFAWNKKYKIVATQNRKKIELSQTEIDRIQDALHQSRNSIAAAARMSGVSVHRIKELLNNKQIKFLQARNKIKNHMPVSLNKANAIAAIVDALQNSKK